VRSVFLDYETVRNGDDSLDHSAIDAVADAAAGTVRYCDFTEDSEIPERLGAADIVLLNKVKLSRAHLTAAAHLKLIALSATGTDNIDLEAARSSASGCATCAAIAPPRWRSTSGPDSEPHPAFVGLAPNGGRRILGAG